LGEKKKDPKYVKGTQEHRARNSLWSRLRILLFN